VANIFIKLTGKRAFVLVAGIAAAALSAKGHTVQTYGFVDGH
jgi:hypothetical protein